MELQARGSGSGAPAKPYCTAAGRWATMGAGARRRRRAGSRTWSRVEGGGGRRTVKDGVVGVWLHATLV